MTAPIVDWPAGGEGVECLHCAIIDLVNKRAQACVDAQQPRPKATTALVALVNVIGDILAQHEPAIAAKMLADINQKMPAIAREAREWLALAGAPAVRH